MATLSTDQIRQLLRNAGFKANSQTENDMVGIAYAESGGNPTAYNGKNKDSSYGLWQINMKGALGPDRRKKFGIDSNDRLFDPAVNAHAAYVVYKESGLDAWTTYKNGEYLKHMDGMTTSEGGNANPITAVKNQFTGISSAIDSVGKNLFKGFANFQGIILAIGLFGIGIAILVSQSKAAKGAAKTAAKVIL